MLFKQIAFAWGSAAALALPLYGVASVLKGNPGGAIGFGTDTVRPALVFIFLGMVGMGLASVRLQEKGAAKSQ